MQSAALSTQKIEKVLDYMRDNRVTLVDVLSYVMDSKSPRCASYRRRVFDNLESTLVQINQHKRGRELLRGGP